MSARQHCLTTESQQNMFLYLKSHFYRGGGVFPFCLALLTSGRSFVVERAYFRLSSFSYFFSGRKRGNKYIRFGVVKEAFKNR